MTLKKIVSFGYKHGVPDAVDGIVVIDIRPTFRNPHRDKALRYLLGTDPRVQQEIEKTPEFREKYAHIRVVAQLPGHEVVYIGCTGGHHRSVFIAEKLGKELGVPVEHRDIEKK